MKATWGTLVCVGKLMCFRVEIFLVVVPGKGIFSVGSDLTESREGEGGCGGGE